MTTPDIFDLYTDYLITSFSYTTATGLSDLVDGAVSHDQITRFLSQHDLTSKELWKVIKKQSVRLNRMRVYSFLMTLSKPNLIVKKMI